MEIYIKLPNDIQKMINKMLYDCVIEEFNTINYPTDLCDYCNERQFDINHCYNWTDWRSPLNICENCLELVSNNYHIDVSWVSNDMIINPSLLVSRIKQMNIEKNKKICILILP